MPTLPVWAQSTYLATVDKLWNVFQLLHDKHAANSMMLMVLMVLMMLMLCTVTLLLISLKQ